MPKKNNRDQEITLLLVDSSLSVSGDVGVSGGPQVWYADFSGISHLVNPQITPFQKRYKIGTLGTQLSLVEFGTNGRSRAF